MKTAQELVSELDPTSEKTRAMSVEQWKAWHQAVQIDALMWVIEQGTPEEAPVNIKAELVGAKITQISLDVAEGDA